MAKTDDESSAASEAEMHAHPAGPVQQSRRRFLASVAGLAAASGVLHACTPHQRQGPQPGPPRAAVAAPPNCAREGVENPGSEPRGHLAVDRGTYYFIPDAAWNPANPNPPYPEQYKLPWVLQPASNTNIAKRVENNLKCKYGIDETKAMTYDGELGQGTIFMVLGK